MSLDSTNPTPPRSVQEALAGYRARAERLDGRVKQLEAELKKTRALMNQANDEARAMDAQLAGLGDDARRRHQRALDASAADPGRRDLAAVVRSTREGIDSYEAITRRTQQ